MFSIQQHVNTIVWVRYIIIKLSFASLLYLILSFNWRNLFSLLLFPPQFEKEKQHDIRSFFSPGGNKEKKRKRTGDEETSPSETTGRGTNSEEREEIIETETIPDEDFSPQVKRLRTPQPSPSLRPQRGGKRRSSAGGKLPSSPSFFSMNPRKLLETGQTSEWSCVSCTYSNSGLMPYCEMCNVKRPSSTAPSGKTQITSWITE